MSRESRVQSSPDVMGTLAQWLERLAVRFVRPDGETCHLGIGQSCDHKNREVVGSTPTRTALCKDVRVVKEGDLRFTTRVIRVIPWTSCPRGFDPHSLQYFRYAKSD